VDVIFCVVRTGRSWRQLPKDFAPWPSVYWYFSWWHEDGAVGRIHDALRNQIREADGHDLELDRG
jgi:transposase